MADLNTLLAKFLAALRSGTPKVYFGSGQTEGSVSGVLTVSTTQAGTTAVTTEEDLWSYTLPANTLSANNKAIRISVYGQWAANGNGKDVRMYFGGSAFLDTGVLTTNNGWWKIEAEIVRTGAGAQLQTNQFFNKTSVLDTTGGTLSKDETTALIIKVTGQNSSASANDIVFRRAIVEALN